MHFAQYKYYIIIIIIIASKPHAQYGKIVLEVILVLIPLPRGRDSFGQPQQ